MCVFGQWSGGEPGHDEVPMKGKAHKIQILTFMDYTYCFAKEQNRIKGNEPLRWFYFSNMLHERPLHADVYKFKLKLCQ